VSEEVKADAVQAEHERLLSLQQKANQKLRELELANEEKAGLLRAALLDRDNLTPELLELMRAELLNRIREQIERVIQEPSDTQPKVLESEANEIAKTVMESQAALDNVKKVSITQLQSQISKNDRTFAFGSPIHTIGSQLGHPASNTTLSPLKLGVSPKRRLKRNTSVSEMSAASAGPERASTSTWGRVSTLFGRRTRRTNESVISETLFSRPCSGVVGFFFALACAEHLMPVSYIVTPPGDDFL
jgi:protein HOOK3